MRALFGIVSLLVVLAIVGLVAARQMKPGAPAASVSAPGSSASGQGAPAANVREYSQQTQVRVKNDVAKALEQGAATRKDEADK